MRLALLLLFTVVTVRAAITPAEWLSSQTPPRFKPGHQLPPLTKYGWPLPWGLQIVTATNWGYALDVTTFGSYLGSNVTNELADAESELAQGVALANAQPTRVFLCVNLERTWPEEMSNGFWVTNSEGLFVDNNTNYYTHRTNASYLILPTSPEAPDTDLEIQAAAIMQPVRAIAAAATNALVILDGGERYLGVTGFDQKSWQFDPRVVANRATNWYRYSSFHKGRHLQVLRDAVDEVTPKMFVWYHSGYEWNRFDQPGYDWEEDWALWGWSSDYLNPALRTPTSENYYLGAQAYTNATGTTWNNVSDLLTKQLNYVGYNIGLGVHTNYTWVTGGYHTTDTNRLSDLTRWSGFLKCLYTAGTVGMNVGYYAFPISQTNSYLLGGPGFDATFAANEPPHWLQQIAVGARIHAQFTWLEDWLFNADLVSGPQSHFMSTDQSAYEFTNTVADANCRVLARKHRTQDRWLITAWAADGAARSVTVTIPTLGEVSVTAAPEGNIYTAPPLALWSPPGGVRTINARNFYVHGP